MKRPESEIWNINQNNLNELPYHVLSINKRVIHSHNFNIVSAGCNSQDQPANPPKPYSNKKRGKNESEIQSEIIHLVQTCPKVQSNSESQEWFIF